MVLAPRNWPFIYRNILRKKAFSLSLRICTFRRMIFFLRPLLPFLILINLLSGTLSAQSLEVWNIQDIRLSGIQNPGLHKKLRKDLFQAKDSADLLRILDPWNLEMQHKGYPEFGLNTFRYDTNTLDIHIHQGPRYLYDEIRLEGLNTIFREKVGIDRLVEKSAPVHWQNLEEKLISCMNLYQNEGYPFATFKGLAVDYELQGTDTMLTRIQYDFEPGPLIRIDSIRIKGNIRENPGFIYSLIRIAPGTPFNQELISDIPRILNNSIYYQNATTPKITFTPFETARLDLSVQKSQAGRFDVLLGLLPPNANDQKLQFTGTMDIQLVSPFRQGELISFKYNKLTTTSQQIEAGLMYPYIFRTPLKIEASLDLFKQEEDFLNLDFRGAALYEFSPFLSAKFYLNTRNSRLLDAAIADTSSLSPVQLDGSREMLGLGLIYENLDYRYNPGKGLQASLDIGLGRRIIRENILLTRRNPEIYDEVDLRQPTQEVNFRIKWYHSLRPRHVIHLANHTYWLGMENYLRNDQLQVGGSRSIRGFNENQFFTDVYTFFTAEYRFQLERDSYMFVFGDYAYLENHERRIARHPAGFGLGMNYGTKAGIISISYAVGGAEGIPFQPARGKIHIGLVNQF